MAFPRTRGGTTATTTASKIVRKDKTRLNLAAQRRPLKGVPCAASSCRRALASALLFSRLLYSNVKLALAGGAPGKDPVALTL